MLLYVQQREILNVCVGRQIKPVWPSTMVNSRIRCTDPWSPKRSLNSAKSTCACSPGAVSKRTSKAGAGGGRTVRRKSLTTVLPPDAFGHGSLATNVHRSVRAKRAPIHANRPHKVRSLAQGWGVACTSAPRVPREGACALYFRCYQLKLGKFQTVDMRSIHPVVTYLHAFDDGRQLRQTLARYFDWYNSERPHTELGKKSPDELCFQTDHEFPVAA